jgi:hypothetical protein
MCATKTLAQTWHAENEFYSSRLLKLMALAIGIAVNRARVGLTQIL